MKYIIKAVLLTVFAAMMLLFAPSVASGQTNSGSQPVLVDDLSPAYPGERREIQLLENDAIPTGCNPIVAAVGDPQQPGAATVVSGFAKTVTYQAPDEPSTEKGVDDSFTATVSCGGFTDTETIEVDLRMPVPLHVTVGVNKIKLINPNDGIVEFSLGGEGCATIDGSIGQDPQWVYPTCSGMVTLVTNFIGGLPFDSQSFVVPQFHPAGGLHPVCVDGVCKLRVRMNNRNSTLTATYRLVRRHSGVVKRRLFQVAPGDRKVRYVRLTRDTVYELLANSPHRAPQELDILKVR